MHSTINTSLFIASLSMCLTYMYILIRLQFCWNGLVHLLFEWLFSAQTMNKGHALTLKSKVLKVNSTAIYRNLWKLKCCLLNFAVSVSYVKIKRILISLVLVGHFFVFNIYMHYGRLRVDQPDHTEGHPFV